MTAPGGPAAAHGPLPRGAAAPPPLAPNGGPAAPLSLGTRGGSGAGAEPQQPARRPRPSRPLTAPEAAPAPPAAQAGPRGGPAPRPPHWPPEDRRRSAPAPRDAARRAAQAQKPSAWLGKRGRARWRGGAAGRAGPGRRRHAAARAFALSAAAVKESWETRAGAVPYGAEWELTRKRKCLSSAPCASP